MSNSDLQQGLLMAQLQQKRALKQKYLRQEPQLPPDSPPVVLENIQKQLRQEAELLSDLAVLAESLREGAALSSILKKEHDKLSALYQQEAQLYAQLPQELKDTTPGKKIRESVLLLGGAVTELDRMVGNMPTAPEEVLRDIAYLLENAGKPV